MENETAGGQKRLRVQTEGPLKCSFGGHESFAFRQGWLKKGVDAVSGKSSAFVDEEAVVRLGVGKNMVRSIRTWCLAVQMIDEAPAEGNSRVKQLRVSSMGERLLADGGWDPYCEDPATLWLLHWLLVSNSNKLSFWRLAFMNFKEREFSRADLAGFVKELSRQLGGKVESGTVERDADCFVRTYVPSRSRQSATGEEDFDCPLTELGVILAGARDRYGFAIGPKDSLCAEVFGFALASFLGQPDSAQLVRSVSSLTFEAGSPGQAFKLDEDSLIDLGRQLELLFPDSVIVDVDGPVRRMGFRRPVEPEQFLDAYYRGGRE